MKKAFIIAIGALLLLNSCGSSTATGGYAGAQFGHIIGSAIGGIAGGGRGHDLGSLIGTIGGAAAGAAIGASIDNKQEQQQQQRSRRQQPVGDDSGFDPTGSGDDRITFEPEPTHRSYSVDELSRRFPIQIRHAEVRDQDGDGVLVRGEECVVKFDIMNNTGKTVYDLSPVVEDATGNKHIAISQPLRIESIAPHQGVRYSARILADKRLKDGQIVVMVGVENQGKLVDSQTRRFAIQTRKKK